MYRCKHHHSCSLILLRGSEDVFQTLDDNQVILSTMKASRFVKAFEREVDQWERQLTHMMDVIEMILSVQRNWIYLEVHNLPCSFIVDVFYRPAPERFRPKQALFSFPVATSCFLFFPTQNIFQGKDIREQLPNECAEFAGVSHNWKTIMGRLHENPNALQGTK
uniref:DYH2 n=1 Tax=Poeciliopsis prolifica TaxID=188132 RepID=A0A0S7EJ20_9TELE